MPSPWVSVVLALAAYRLTRLAGWDDFPLAAKIRAWVIGERWVPILPWDDLSHDPVRDIIGAAEHERQSQFPRPAMQEIGRSDDDPLEPPPLPGKQPPSEVDVVRPAYDRPTLAHLIHCPFCVGWWISLITWLAWLAWHPVLYGLIPLAISGVVGLISKNLDA